MSDDDPVHDELIRLAGVLEAVRLASPDTVLYGIACLIEASHVLRAVRTAGIVGVAEVTAMLQDATTLALSPSPTKHVVVVTNGDQTAARRRKLH